MPKNSEIVIKRGYILGNDIYSKGMGSAFGGQWKPAKEEDRRFLGEPGEIKKTQSTGKKGGYLKETKIGEDGKAVKERHYTNAPNPKYHTNPHDHDIDWSGGFPKPGPPINYPDCAPIFKCYKGVMSVPYIIGPNTPEENRFKTISDFKWCINCGGEVEFTYNDKVFGICPKLKRTENSTFQILISQIYIENAQQTEKWCDTADEVLEYMINGDRLRDIITEVEVTDRTI